MLNFKKYLFELLPLRNYIDGFTMSNDVSDVNNAIRVMDGVAMNSLNDEVVRMTASMIKRLNAVWAVGSGNGGLDTGVKAVSTTYHVFIIRKPDGTHDGLFSLSSTAPTLPTGYTKFRRVGSVVTDVSGNIRQFLQSGDFFALSSPLTAINQAQTTLVTTVGNPSGIRTEVLGQVGVQQTSDNSAIGGAVAECPDTTGGTVNFSGGNFPTAVYGFGGGRIAGSGGSAVGHGSFVSVLTNSAGQIRLKGNNGNTNMTFTIVGWKDSRGKQ